MGAVRRRLGIVVPSSNTVVEDFLAGAYRQRALRNNLAIHLARFRVTHISDHPASRAQFEREAMLAAAESLAEARVEHILWGGTAAGWLGRKHDAVFIETVHDRFGLPASTAVMALDAALARHGARQIGLVTPYIESLERHIIEGYAEIGVSVATAERLNLTVNTDYAAVPESVIAEMVDRAAAARPDAVVILCTNLAGAQVAQAAGVRLGLPVLDSTAVAIEDAIARLDPDPETAADRRAAQAMSG